MIHYPHSTKPIGTRNKLVENEEYSTVLLDKHNYLKTHSFYYTVNLSLFSNLLVLTSLKLFASKFETCFLQTCTVTDTRVILFRAKFDVIFGPSSFEVAAAAPSSEEQKSQQQQATRTDSKDKATSCSNAADDERRRLSKVNQLNTTTLPELSFLLLHHSNLSTQSTNKQQIRT